MDQILSWVVTVIGITGFFLAGKRIWWCWYLNLFCQVLWYWYATVSNTPAFYVAATFYTGVFGINAWKWTKEHIAVKRMLEEEAERNNRINLPKYY
ncbi:PnuC-like nicotinamide riboside transporter [Arthrobacter phage Lewando]|nr:PnuC-like nicotinamide riboside transporter [Arthrobacter phage Lewando]